MKLTLWDGESGNAIGDFDNMADALAAVREDVALNGPVDLGLIEGWGTEMRLVAADAALREMAQRSADGEVA